MSPWRYESDGSGHDKSHYCWRDDPTKPCGVDRVDFGSSKEAKAWRDNANRLILKLSNAPTKEA